MPIPINIKVWRGYDWCQCTFLLCHHHCLGIRLCWEREEWPSTWPHDTDIGISTSLMFVSPLWNSFKTMLYVVLYTVDDKPLLFPVIQTSMCQLISPVWNPLTTLCDKKKNDKEAMKVFASRSCSHVCLLQQNTVAREWCILSFKQSPQTRTVIALKCCLSSPACLAIARASHACAHLEGHAVQAQI